ncbi:hypothetical protein QFC24_005845 [Naganishia onofrii]|uniref:Uncharacterized protein n=1 Tax=Naganishia onofrii TaxID=1851511 RepID=A0ACC2X7I3_9TREE|nr:hypothetical protein QFC24_005845 [Naganishia onofrii]
MRFTTAIVAAFAIASFGVQALPAPNEPTKSAYSSSLAPSATHKYEHAKPSDKYEPEPYKPEDDKEHEPEYDIVCKKFAFFHNWDITCGDLTCGPTEGKYIYDCAKDCLENEDCDATVSFEGYCYPKTLDYFQASNLVKSKGRDLAIEGCCEDLTENYKKTKCCKFATCLVMVHLAGARTHLPIACVCLPTRIDPDGFLDCCYDKEICTKVYKEKDDYKKEEPKKEEPKKEEPKKEEPKKDDKKW